jgi:peroxiredoxin Q/BCP
MITVGTPLPDITVKDDHGASVKLTDLKRPLVVYFYPKADTPGCTIESNQFNALYEDFKKKGAEVVGVSRDSVDDQCAFKDKFSFAFPLLADTESKICDAFGVIVERERDGKKSMGIARTTFLIGPDGKVSRVWPNVSPEGHAQEVLSAL